MRGKCPSEQSMMSSNDFKSAIRSRVPGVARWGDALQRRLTVLSAPVQRMLLRPLIKSYYAASKDAEVLQLLDFIDYNQVQMIPYDFVARYDAVEIDVCQAENGYPYVVVQGKQVYFPKEMSQEEIRAAVKAALVEQDPRSPHCYSSGSFSVSAEDAGVFIGASDGIYCLSILEYFKAVYLFEVDQKWLIPLTMTFAPWGDKVKIIQKFVSDRDGGDELSLDTFAATIKEKITYLQADVEGAEKKLLMGGQKLLAGPGKMKISLCSYHRHNDFNELGNILKASGFAVSHSQGYLIMWMQVPLRKPYLRRGVIYAEKSV